MVMKKDRMDQLIQDSKTNVKFEDLKIIKNLINDVEDETNEFNGFLKLNDSNNKTLFNVAPKLRVRNSKISDKYRKISNSDTLINNVYLNASLQSRFVHNNNRSSFNHNYVFINNKAKSLQNMLKSADSLYYDFIEKPTDTDNNVEANSIKSNNYQETNNVNVCNKRKRKSSCKQKVKYSSINVDDIQNAAKKHQDNVKNNVKEVSVL